MKAPEGNVGNESVAEPDAQISRPAAHAVLSRPRGPAQRLNTLARHVDHKLEEQLAPHRASEALKAQCDDWRQMADAQHKLDAVRGALRGPVPLVASQHAQGGDQVAEQRLNGTTFNEAAVIECGEAYTPSWSPPAR
jgi:hypothetical protein